MQKFTLQKSNPMINIAHKPLRSEIFHNKKKSSMKIVHFNISTNNHSKKRRNYNVFVLFIFWSKIKRD